MCNEMETNLPRELANLEGLKDTHTHTLYDDDFMTENVVAPSDSHSGHQMCVSRTDSPAPRRRNEPAAII